MISALSIPSDLIALAKSLVSLIFNLLLLGESILPKTVLLPSEVLIERDVDPAFFAYAGETTKSELFSTKEKSTKHEIILLTDSSC